MATLTREQLFEVSKQMAKDTTMQDWGRLTIEAALQAIEDWYEAGKASGSTAIDTATSPYVFSNPMKKKLFRFWLMQKSKREAD